ncbi:MAG: protein jag [Nakamurella sp.]
MNRSAVDSVHALEDPPAPTAADSAAVVDADAASDDSGDADDADDSAGADGVDDSDDADGSAGADGGSTDESASTNGASRTPGSRRAPAHEQLVAEGDAAGDYLERLLDILDYDGDIDLDVEGERAVVSIVGAGDDVEKLVGDRGEVLDALQELTRLAATAETGQRSRLMLDVAGYRAQRRTELAALGARTAEDVLESGEAVRLAPMNPFERKIVHDAVAAVDGVSSASEGGEPRRRVVVSVG